MLKLSKKVEYGLIAVRHIAASQQHISTAKEIAERYKIPYELLAKVMQKLAKQGIITSYQGVNGGYALARKPDEISISHVIIAIEGNVSSIAQCFSNDPVACSIFDSCTIKNPLEKFQHNLEHVFDTMKVSEII